MTTWRNVPLGEAIELAYGRSLPKRARTSQGSIPVYGSSGITGWHDEALVKESTVIVGRKGSAGAVHLANGPCFPIDTTYFVRVRDGFDFDTRYIYYLLRQMDLGRLKTATGVPGLSREDAYRELIAIPPIDEQRRIVDILARAEGIVRLRREAQKKAAELVPAIFLEMFGDPATNPKGWPRRSLGSVVQAIDSGASPKCIDRQKQDGEWGVLRLGSVSTCDYIEDEHKTLPHDLRPSPAAEVMPGDVLISRKNTYDLVGAAAYVWRTQGRILLPDLIFRLRPSASSSVLPIYLWAMLTTRSKRAAIRQLASGSAESMPNISKRRLGTLQIEIPPLELQSSFARAAHSVHSVAEHQRRAAALSADNLRALLNRTFSSRGIEGSSPAPVSAQMEFST